MRLLIYSHDAYGLGNTRRMLSIAGHLLAQAGDRRPSILLLSGSPVLHRLEIPEGIEYVKLPSVVRTEQGRYESWRLPLDLTQITRLRAALIRDLALDYRPDVVLVDKKPLGLNGELRPMLDAFSTRPRKPRLMLLLRDILDEASVTCRIWRRNDYYGVLERHYERILVLGCRHLFDVARQYRLPPTLEQRLEYCGYIRRGVPAGARDATRRELGVGRAPLILVTPGGGADGARLVNGWLDSLALQPRDGALHSLVLAGPHLPAREQHRLRDAAARNPGLQIMKFTDSPLRYMAAADLVLCMGGYNTLCEVLSLRKRAIVVPRVSPVREQWLRALCLSRLGLVRIVHPDQLNAAQLHGLVRQALEDPAPHPARAGIDMNGLDRVCKALLSPAPDSPSSAKESCRHAV